MASLKRFAWYRPVTCWAVVSASSSTVFLLLVGVSVTNVVRASVGGFVLLVAGVVLAAQAYYADANRRAREPDRGALPSHVKRISESYVLLLVFCLIEVWTRAEEPLSWRIPLLALAGVQGIRALLALIAFERRRVFFVAPFVTDLRGSPHEPPR